MVLDSHDIVLINQLPTSLDGVEKEHLAIDLLKLCHDYQVPFIVNDDVFQIRMIIFFLISNAKPNDFIFEAFSKRLHIFIILKNI
jgi:hypothetical protein